MSDNLYPEPLKEEILERLAHDERLQKINRAIQVGDELEKSAVVAAIMETLKRIQTEALERLLDIDPDARGKIAQAQAEANVVRQLQVALHMIGQEAIAANIGIRETSQLDGGSLVGDH